MLKILIALGLFVPSLTTEKATAINAHEFLVASGDIFAVYDMLSVGAEYTVTFRTHKTKTRTDDEILKFKEMVK